jgi:PIN domain nuclease of toxin-antitoxin system
MRLLLDTHALIWWLAGSEDLSASAKAAISDQTNEIYVSAVSAWEIATKYRMGKLPDAQILAVDFDATIAAQGFRELPISVRHGQLAGGLPLSHRDPWDRMLAAQATLESMSLVSRDEIFDHCGVSRLW